MGAATRNLKCRFEESGHSRVVIFHREDGEEIFILPAERLDPGTLEKLKSGGVVCGVHGPSGDGTSSLHLATEEGEVLYEQKVWIRSATWARMLREQEH
ncbi:MAG TPA: hypothetical protein VE007_08350 [Thermoanaerobaculia bacterium]|nr:hypothetical protein [Thermoanaerobaculia bacterium]